MTGRILRTQEDVSDWGNYLNTFTLPITVSVKKGADRSIDQNKLAFKWFKEIGEQLDGWEASDARAHCKLNIGVKMLHAENDDFREQWNRLIRGRFTYEELLDLMLPPHDYPVSRIMGVRQMGRFLDQIWDEFRGMGVTLTLPEQLDRR